jgi:hypothetical protein
MNKTMKKTLAALAAMTALVACTGDNDFTEPVADVKTYQVSIPASLGGDAPTRAVSFDGTTSSSTFQAAERVYVYNATSGKVMLNAEGTAAGCLTPTNISADGKSCDLTGTLTGTIEATDQLLLMYNLNEVEDGNDNNRIKTYSDFNYNGQDGTAAGVLDGATATLTGWSIGDGNVLTTAGTAQFENLQSMFRFSFKDAADLSAALSVKQVYITSQNDALVRWYYPMADEASRYDKAGVAMFTDQALSGYVYMALCIDEASSAADVLTFQVTDGDGNKYEGTKAAPAAGFKNGKYYYSSAPIALTLKERRILPTITWTTPASAPATIGDEMIVIEDANADFALSGTSEGVYFVLKRSGTVRLNGLTASYGSDNDCFIDGIKTITLDISGANTIACKNVEMCILAPDYLKLQGYGTLTVTANDATHCGLRGNANYAPANNGNATTTELDVSTQLAATGYKVVRSARTDNADGTYTWTYTVTSTTLDLSSVKSDVTVYDGTTLTGTLGAGYKVTIAAGATVTFSGMTIAPPNEYSSLEYPGIDCAGNANIILVGENVVEVNGRGDAGIFVPSGSTLTIDGTGSLTAEGGSYDSTSYGAGIGGNSGIACGNIVINGGTVTAVGHSVCAGIGSGSYASCGTITINGGTVTATGGGEAAGIGSGGYGSCGNITISGGTVEATGGQNAAGIGCGNEGFCGNITIATSITSVTAMQGMKANGSTDPIGKGVDATGLGTVTFGGVTVYDVGSWDGPYTGEDYGGLTLSITEVNVDPDPNSVDMRTVWTLTPTSNE